MDTLSDRLGLSTRQTEPANHPSLWQNLSAEEDRSQDVGSSYPINGSNKRISEIASDLGYSSVEHFSTAFRRYYNHPLEEYRKNSLNISAEQKNDI